MKEGILYEYNVSAMSLEFIKHVAILHLWLSIYVYGYYVQVKKMDEKQGL